MNGKLGINKRIADQLLAHGFLDDADHATSVDFARRKNLRVEEALLQLGLIEEAQLLKYIATVHKTQFVSTERMSKAKIDRQALDAIPRKLADHFAVYPLVLDRRTDKLIIATADPDDANAIKELKIAANVQRVLPMVARPEAVRAAIARGYDGDRSVFVQVMRPQVTGFPGTLADDDPFEAAERRRQQYRTGRAEEDRPGARRRLQRTGPGLADQLRGRERPHTRPRPSDDEHWPELEERPVHELPRREDRTGYPGESYNPVRTGRRSTGGGDRGRFGADAGGKNDGLPRRDRRSSSPGEFLDDLRRGSPPPRSAEGSPHPSAGRRPSEPERPRYDRRHADSGYTPVPGYAERGYSEPGYHDPDYAEHAQAEHGQAEHVHGYEHAEARRSEPRYAAPRHPSPPPAQHAPQDFARSGAKATPTPQHGYGSPPISEVPHSAPVQRRRLSLLPPMRAMAMAPAAVGFGALSDRQPSSDVPEPAAVLASTPYLESLRVLIGLLENERPQLRAHSTAVARLSMSLCERITLPKDHAQAIVLASYLHDLGKMGSHHLTALNVALFDGHRDLAAKLVAIPQQLMESVGLTAETTNALASMYEQMGGGGLPDGLSGKEIPMGARILAVADSFADLTRNADNAHGALLSSEDAIALMREYATTVFDPNILDVLEEATGGERILTDLLANRHRVVLIDRDPEETMVLQLRMVEQGFDVHIARTVEEARSELANHEFALVVSEIDLDMPDDGFKLLQEHAQLAQNMSWVFLSGRETRETAERAFKLGADDFITKPVATEVVVAKLTQLVERQAQRVAPHGVSGALSQMGLPDIVQILWHGRKTCALIITQGELEGAIHFSEGRIVNAEWGDAEGEVAFYRMVGIQEDGNFRVDPEFVPEGEPVIHASPEGLLLEGIRLLDEGAIP